MGHSEDINKDEEDSIEEDEFSPIDFIPSEDIQSGMHKPSGENMWKSNASFNRIGIGLLDVPMASGESVYDNPDAGGSEPLGIGYVSRPEGLRDSDYEENFDDVNNENSLPAGNMADKKGAKMKKKIALDYSKSFRWAYGDAEFRKELLKIGIWPKDGVSHLRYKKKILNEYIRLTRKSVTYYENRGFKTGVRPMAEIRSWLLRANTEPGWGVFDLKPVVRSLRALNELDKKKKDTEQNSDLRKTPIDKQIESDSLYGRESYIDSSIESDSFYDIDDDVVNIKNKGRGNSKLTSQKALMSKKRFESQTKVSAGKYLSTIREFQKRLKVLINNDLGVDGDWGSKSSKAWIELLKSNKALSEAISLGDSKSIYRIVMNEKGAKNIGTIDSGPKTSPKEKDVPTKEDAPPKVESAPPIEGEKPGQVPDSSGKEIDVSEFVVATLLPEDNPKKRGVALLNFRGNRPEGIRGSGDFETLVKETSGWKISSVTPVERRILMMKSKGKLEKSDRKMVRRKMRRDNRTTRRLNRMKSRKAALNDCGVIRVKRASEGSDSKRSSNGPFEIFSAELEKAGLPPRSPQLLTHDVIFWNSVNRLYSYYKKEFSKYKDDGNLHDKAIIEPAMKILEENKRNDFARVNKAIAVLGRILSIKKGEITLPDADPLYSTEGGRGYKVVKEPLRDLKKGDSVTDPLKTDLPISDVIQKKRVRPSNAFEIKSFTDQTGITVGRDQSIIKEFQKKIREKDTHWLGVDGIWGDKSAMAWAIFLEKPENKRLKEAAKSKDGDRVKSLFLYDREYISKDSPQAPDVSVNSSSPVEEVVNTKPIFAPPISSEIPGRGGNKPAISDDAKPIFAPPISSETPGRGRNKPAILENAKPIFAPPISPEAPAPIRVKPTSPESGDAFVEVRDFVVSTMSKDENPKRRDVALLRFDGDRPEGLAGSGEYDTAARSGGVWSISSVSPVERRMLILKSKNILSRKDLRGVRKKLRRDNRTTRRLDRMNNRRKASIEILETSKLKTALEARLSRLIK